MNRIALLTALTTTLAAAALGTSTASAAVLPPGNDSISGAETVTTAAAESYTLEGATFEPGEYDIDGGQDDTVWFKWTPSSTGAAYADVCGAVGGNHLVHAYEKKTGYSLQVDNLKPVVLAGPDNPVTPSMCRDRFLAYANTTYYFQVDRSAGAVSDGSLLVSQDTSAPTTPVVSPSWQDVTGPKTTIKITPPAGATYVQCKVDAGSWFACHDGYILLLLTDGPHAASMRAIDAHGNISAVAKKQWTVDAVAPEAELGPVPATVAPGTAVEVPFVLPIGADEPYGECRVDGGAWAKCESFPYVVAPLAVGTHTAEVRGVDRYGNKQNPPATASWTVVEPAKPQEQQQPQQPQQQPQQPQQQVQPEQQQPQPEPRRAVETPRPAACTLTLAAPKRVSRKTLRKRGLRGAVKPVARTTGPCKAKVALKRGKGRIVVTATAGSLRRTAAVRVA